MRRNTSFLGVIDARGFEKNRRGNGRGLFLGIRSSRIGRLQGSQAGLEIHRAVVEIALPQGAVQPVEEPLLLLRLDALLFRSQH